MLRLLVVLALPAAGALGQLRVVATVPDLADLARQIGGDAVKVDSLMAGHEDLHLVRVRPSSLIKLRRADVFLQLGLDAEHSWVPSLLRNARNRKVRPGGKGFCNASAGVAPLEVPSSISRGDGPDLHPRGNPHYNLDPRRMRTAARNVRDVLKQVDPDNAKTFDAGLQQFEKTLDKKLAAWTERLLPFKGAAFIEYHSAWVYFADAFGLRIVAKLEPKPGLSPSPAHLARVIRIAKDEKVGLVVARPWNADLARRVAKDAGARAVVLQICSAREGKTAGWFAYMDAVVEAFATNLRRE